MEDFNFDEFMEDSEKDFEKNLEEYKERMMIEAINANYENIERKGINEEHLISLDKTQLKDLDDTFSTMINYFIELEEYEKCATIQKHLDIVQHIIKKDTVINTNI